MAGKHTAHGERLGDFAGKSNRRENVEDRRVRVSDRRECAVDRRGLFADRRQATEARYRAPLDMRLPAQLTACQELERRRIAADLHDSIGSSLCTVKLKLQDAIGRLQGDAARLQVGSVAEIISDVSRAMDEVRRIAMDLRPSILDDLGIVATIAWLSRELEGAHQDVRVVQEIGAREVDIPNALKTPIFRILQEGLNNAMKHSGARVVRVTLKQDAQDLRLTIEDDGKGFHMAEVLGKLDFSQHFGIANMRQRANGSGGSLTIKSTPGAGVVVSCAWPRVIR